MIVRSSIVVILLVVAMGARARLDAPTPVTTAEPLSRFPAAITAYTSRDIALAPDVIALAAVDDHLNRQYSGNGTDLGLYVGYYQSQRQGEALHSPLYCLPGTGWQPVVTRQVPLRVDGKELPVNEVIVQRGPDRLVVMYWYQTLYRVTASEYARKLFLMTDAFTSGRTDVALVRVIAPIGVNEDIDRAQGLQLARPFAEQVLPAVQKHLFRE